MTKSGTLLRVNDQNTTKIWSQSSMRTKRGLGTILWAIDENMGTNLQAFYKHFYIGCLKTQKQQLHFVNYKQKLKFKYFFVIFLIRAGRCIIGQGAR